VSEEPGDIGSGQPHAQAKINGSARFNTVPVRVIPRDRRQALTTIKVILLIAELALVVTAVLYVVFSRRWTLRQSALWLLVILIIPWAGSIVFLLADQVQASRRRALRTGPD
jgi:hypothetical protein